MSDNTKLLVDNFRLKLLEYDKAPYDDVNILILFNDAYRWAYNHFVKSHSSLFSQIHPINIIAGTYEYDLPENLWGKRINQFIIPAPPNQGANGWAFTEVDKVDYRHFYRYRSNKLRVLYPEVWSQLNNKIYIGPPSIASFPAELVTTFLE